MLLWTDSGSYVINRWTHPIFPLITGLNFAILIWQQQVAQYYNSLCGEDTTK